MKEMLKVLDMGADEATFKDAMYQHELQRLRGKDTTFAYREQEKILRKLSKQYYEATMHAVSEAQLAFNKEEENT